jgi:hypothetical protein
VGLEIVEVVLLLKLATITDLDCFEDVAGSVEVHD